MTSGLEAIGFAIGLFGACVDAYNVIAAGRGMRLDYPILCCRFEVERVRLLLWGEGIGLANIPPNSDVELDRLHKNFSIPAVQSSMLGNLCCLKQLFHDADKLKRKYGLRMDYSGVDDVCGPNAESGSSAGQILAPFPAFLLEIASNAAYDNVRHFTPERMRMHTSLARRATWVIGDNAKFRTLLADIKDLIDGLHQLFPDVSSRTHDRFTQGIVASDDIDGLQLLEEALAVDHRGISETARIRLRNISSSTLSIPTPPTPGSTGSTHTAEGVPSTSVSPSVLWTPDDLLEHWITCPSEDEFPKTIVSAFMTCSEVFEGLRRRFSDAGMSENPKQAQLRHRILSVMYDWVESPYSINPGVLAQLKLFTDSVTSSGNIADIARRIRVAIIRKGKEQTVSPPSSPRSSIRKLSNTSAQIAAALTALEGLQYTLINPVDYTLHLRQSQGPSLVADALATTDKITSWVKHRILRPETVDQRHKVFTIFLEAAQDCYRRRNFSSAAAITAALNSEPITVLSETLPASYEKVLTKLSQLVKEPAYRKAIGASRDPYLPCLGYHLRKLSIILQECLPNVEEGCQAQVDLKGCAGLAAWMHDVMRAKAYHTGRVRDPDRLAYVQSELRHTKVNAPTEADLISQSRDLKKRYRESRAGPLIGIGIFITM